ncbi:MAG: dihydrolipoyl dehydrogenase [Verrucomicrobiales bacterium]
MDYDLIVIGGGPAGYVGAIRAAQLGRKVACVEDDAAGGTCLNWGCIPTKALLQSAERYHFLQTQAAGFGFSFDNLSFDWSRVIGRSRKVSGRLVKGIEFLFKKHGIDYLRGTGSLVGEGLVEVRDAEGKVESHRAENILIATGCRSQSLPSLPFDGEKVLSSKRAMTLAQRPESIIIVGGGAIGVEFAYFFNAFGTRVTLVEMLDHLVPVEDSEISEALAKSFTKAGIEVLTGHRTTAADTAGEGVRLTVEPTGGGGEGRELSAELCLVAVGLKPRLPAGAEGLTLTERGYLCADARYRTSAPGIYAAGDIIGPPWLAHVASFEAIQCVEGLYLEDHTPRKVEIFPGCTYCHPEVASVGLTERACVDQGLDFKIGKFPFMASGRALAAGESEGFVKLIFGTEFGELLGAHIIGAGATELIAEMALALNLEVTGADLEATIHAHPSLSEAIAEATGAAFGHGIHI